MYDEKELKEIFHFFDRDHNSRINLTEFGELLNALGVGSDMSDEEKRIGFRDIDANGNGSISFQEFSDWWNER